jgi:hypothetical protein
MLAGKVILYVGVLLTGLGFLLSASTVWTISFTQGLCAGGLSPQPVQGCGYVPELVMFNWGPNNQYPILLFGLYLIFAGNLIMVLRWIGVRENGLSQPPG